MEIQERRLSKRLKINLPISFAQLEGEKHFGETLSKDISSAGVRMNTNTSFPVNSNFLVKLRFLDKNVTVEGKAKIVWSNRISFPEQYQAGLEFYEMNPIFKKWIGEYILAKENQSE